MIYKTHASSSLNLALLVQIVVAKFHGFFPSFVMEYFSFCSYAMYGFGVVFGAFLPDLDEPNSYISKKTPILPQILNAAFGHRGVTHYLIVGFLLVLFSVVFFLVYPEKLLTHAFLSGVALGYLGHILGDSLTKSGINGAMFPFKGTLVLLPKMFRFKTASDLEFFVILPLNLLFNVVFSLYLFFYVFSFKRFIEQEVFFLKDFVDQCFDLFRTF